ncbi:response regulator [Caldanaerobacter subterraneus]|uniref:Stage 0 sporulation protein A homolog n=1 Tax=Caldanaerobacter subterraneus TaxID=911092 RepID=A0A7Y2PMB7_9THEO|nr:response regulator [Caldanaerobacter subterraneus]NNG68196.1 response regulator [Caldanaerobacter subterraneus]
MEKGKETKDILVVDDSVLVRLMVKDILGGEGYNVVAAVTSEEAVRKIKSRKELFDLIIVDINLPDQNGFEFIRNLKSEEKYRHIPVIILSAEATVPSIKRAVEAGAVDYLVKPFKAEELVKRVVKLVGSVKKEDRYPELKDLLKKEVNRARRGNVNLSLVLAHCEGKIAGEISKIAEKIRSKLRDIDAVFEINENTLALVLPVTGREGAEVVVKKIQGELRGSWRYAISTYPDNGKDEEELINFSKESLMKGESNSSQEDDKEKEEK